MIDEKKLIEDLKAKVYPEKFGEKCNAIDVISGVLQVIDEQPKTDCSECSRRKFYQQGYQDGLNADKWIPCEERLPELEEGMEFFKQSKPCLVALKWWDGETTEEVGWYNQNGLWSNDSEHCKVIAWQPFKPYKKEGAE